MNARNPFPGTIHFDLDDRENLYCADIEVDYKGDDVTYETILNLIRGRYDRHQAPSKRLQSNEGHRIFIYMNGHGGENFFKIQDTQVVHSEDFAKVFDEMRLKHLYKEILLILDTCEAMSLFDQVEAEDILMVGTSTHGQHALSHLNDFTLNTYLNDKFTYFFYEYLRKDKKGGRGMRISEFPSYFSFDKLQSDLKLKSTLKGKKAEEVYIGDYIPLKPIKHGIKRFNYSVEKEDEKTIIS